MDPEGSIHLLLLHVIEKKPSLEGRRLFERSANSVPQCEELPVVVAVKQMMIRVVCRTIDDWLENFWDSVVAIMDGYSPNINKNEQAQIDVLIQREDEWV